MWENRFTCTKVIHKQISFNKFFRLLKRQSLKFTYTERQKNRKGKNMCTHKRENVVTKNGGTYW